MMQQGMIDLLKTSKLFCDLEREVIQNEILPYGTFSQYSKNATIISSGEQVNQFGFILSGKVHILQSFPNGVYSLQTVLPRFYILAADLVCTQSRCAPYDAIAAEQTECLMFPAKLMQKGTLSEQTRVTLLERMLTLVSHENMRKHYRIAILSQQSLRDRILTYLTMQANKRGTYTLQIPFNRDELADFLCVNRSALSRELSRMQKDGLIYFHKNVFTLLPELYN